MSAVVTFDTPFNLTPVVMSTYILNVLEVEALPFAKVLI